MIALRKLCVLFSFVFLISYSNAQNINWMLGVWKGAGDVRKSHFIRTLEINSVSAESFTGTRSKEADDRNHSKIVTVVTGHINKDTFYLKDGAIVFKKDPPHTTWLDCTQCIPINKVFIDGDSIILSSTVIDCKPYCDGTSVYFKLIPDFDTATQRVVINMFGTPEQIYAFNSKAKTIQPVASSDPDAVKPNGNSADETAKRKQQFQDSLRLAGVATKQREQQMLDSLKLVVIIAKKRQQQIDDSLQNVTIIKKQRQQQIEDSLQYLAKIKQQKRQQEIADSLKNAAQIVKQKQQQYDDSVKIAKKQQQQIADSLQTVAKLEQQRRQQQIDDSLLTAKQKQQRYDDSVKIAKKRQQEIADSLQTIAKLEQQRRQQQIDDSLLTAKQKQQRYDDSVKIAKKRQQEIADSLQTVANIAKQKRQQQIDDSLKNAVLIAKQNQQRYVDSIKIAKKRQQEIADSLQTIANIAKQKRQQQIADSIKNAALVAKQNQQRYDDSIKIAKKRQQEIADSLQTVANIAKQKRQQQIADSIKNAALTAKQNQQRYDDSVKIAKAREQHILDSLNNIAQLKKIRDQQIADSLKIAEAKKQPIPDTAKTTAAKAQADKTKALTQRENVLLNTYHIKNPDILIELFDNAEIDGDRVSVFHNNELIVSNQTLLREPITFKVHADSSSRMHEFILIAENLGTIPPNTALMRVTADKQVYKLSVKTDLKTNAKIVFYYDGN